MNNRMRQICRLQLAMIKKNDAVMGVLRDEGIARAIFFPREQIEQYKQRYGDKIEIWG